MERRHPKQGHRVKGAAITDFRRRTKITSAQLAAKCRISVTHLRNIESGVMPASLEVACRIAAAVGVPARDFIEDPAVLDAASILQRRRLAVGLTRTEAAQKAGCSRQHLNLVENGRKQPSLRLLRGLAVAYVCSIADIDPHQATGSAA